MPLAQEGKAQKYSDGSREFLKPLIYSVQIHWLIHSACGLQQEYGLWDLESVLETGKSVESLSLPPVCNILVMIGSLILGSAQIRETPMLSYPRQCLYTRIRLPNRCGERKCSTRSKKAIRGLRCIMRRVRASYLGLPESCLCDPNTWKLRPIANVGTNRAKSESPLACMISWASAGLLLMALSNTTGLKPDCSPATKTFYACIMVQ